MAHDRGRRVRAGSAIEARTGETLWTFGTRPMFDWAATTDGVILHLGNELVRVSWPG